MYQIDIDYVLRLREMKVSKIILPLNTFESAWLFFLALAMFQDLIDLFLPL